MQIMLPNMNKRSVINISPGQVLVIGFASVIFAGSLLLMTPWATSPGVTTKYIDALFTSTSAVCVTGLITVLTATQWTFFGKVVVLSLIQIGGLGIMTMSALFFLALGRRFSLKNRLVMQEALGTSGLAGLVRITKRILMITFLIEGTGAMILYLRLRSEMPDLQALWYGIFHSVSAFCNAGFDIFGNSLESYVSDWVICQTIAWLIILGGIGFMVIFDVWETRARFQKLTLHSKTALVVTAFLIVSGTLLIYAFEYNNPATLVPLSADAKWLAAFFQAVTPRTAGYNSLLIGKMMPASLFLTIVLMFIGASPGGTGGGIKTTTFAVIIATVYAITTGKDTTIGHRRIMTDIIQKSFVITFLALFLLVLGITVMCVSEQQDFLAIAYDATSAFGTVGLTMGITPFLTNVGKIVLISLMFAGRVGPLTVAMALTTQGPKPHLHFPEDRVMVG
jgi:trk system potassium uptake protein TrkH